MTHATDHLPPPIPPAIFTELSGEIARGLRPFARVTVGPRSYQVAHGRDEAGKETLELVFRCEDGDAWTGISRRLEDGWRRIAADFVQHDADVLTQFLRTHAVRLDGWYKIGETIRFDTLGTIWSVTRPAIGISEVTFGEREPVVLDPVMVCSLDLRHQAIDNLITAFPDLRDLFAAEIDHWAYRLASGATITPIL